MLAWRAAAVALLLGGGAWAPPLTTIQDVLYRADGTRFDGVAFIEWKTFEAADTSNIATSRVTVRIVNGNLYVQLVPTTNALSAAYYQVRYNGEGRFQFEERWAVPPSTTPLRLREVRIAGMPGSPITPPPLEEIQESDVVGLLNDLAIRPVKGPGYGPTRVAYINQEGALEAVVGNVSDCVRVDGTSGPCGDGAAAAGPGFVDGETPAGLINGSNTVFTLANAPAPAASLALYRNGVRQKADLDYTLSGNTITSTAGSVPQPDDVLLASYRLEDSGNPAGSAGGALTGYYPNPSLAAGVVSDVNVADAAAIRESKLALTYPTHSNASDPSPDQKAALAGSAGTPSGTNRYVTNQDARLSDARMPQAHDLLGASHGDTSAGSPVRGDLIVAQGAAPASWTRLPVGQPNRCLMSNGFDAVWNTCLYTAFSAGSVPFVDAAGNLAQNNSRLFWDNSNRRLSVGNNAGTATLYVYDATAGTGTTGLTVRAGPGQGANPLQRWLDASGNELARLEESGVVAAPSYRAASSVSRAGWRETGTGSDPASPSDGDQWFNTTALARRSVEGGQVHTTPQVLCSSAGFSTSSAALTRLASCTIPANLLKPGDRVDIRFDYAHEGATTGFTFEVRWGATVLVSRSAGSNETAVAGRGDAAVHSAGAQWNVQSWGATLLVAAGVGNASDSLAAPLIVDCLGRMAASTGDTIALRNMTVIRYPFLDNP